VNAAGRALARGLAAGVAGTIAMDLVWFSRYRRGGGDSAFAAWEVTTDIASWDDAPAPAQMGRKLVERVSGRELSVERAAALNNVMHWAYGASGATGSGALTPRRGGPRAWWQGPAFGGVVWASDYVVLPLAGVYEPIWRYDVPTLWKDLSAHLVFGTATDATLRLL
jgi:hypothetical protein